MVKRSECTCPCHTPGSKMIHFAPCCEPDDNPLQDAIDELAKHDKLKIIDKLHDCRHPKWERLLRNLVTQLTDKTVRF